ncbi:MAG: hypothetical protein ACK49I_10930, partial [Verrucomicrobiota bacterium]
TGYGKNAAAGLLLSSGINPLVSGFDDMCFSPLSSSIHDQWAIKNREVSLPVSWITHLDY